MVGSNNTSIVRIIYGKRQLLPSSPTVPYRDVAYVRVFKAAE